MIVPKAFVEQNHLRASGKATDGRSLEGASSGWQGGFLVAACVPNRDDIVHLLFDFASGQEMKDKHFGLVISLKAFNARVIYRA